MENNIVVGMFERDDQALAFVSALRERGFTTDQIMIDESAQSRGGAAPETRTFFQKIGDALSGRDQQTFSEGLRRGHTLISVQVTENQVDDIASLMRSHGAFDIDERVSTWEKEGFRLQEDNDFRSVGASQQNLRQQNLTQELNQRNLDEKEVLPVVEEQLRVGKRSVERGGVRVFSHVTERPVEEQINLREERVVVDRRPVDRPVTGNEPGLFQEASFEVTERAEEAVVSKEARVVEEVVVGKEATEHTETIRDTVRRTDVDVQQIAGGQRLDQSVDAYSTYDTEYQDHYRTQFTSAGYPYDYYAPAYRYGSQLAGTDEYRGRSWDDIEPHVQRSWETQNPGTWERVKDAVRYGWDRLTGRAATSRANRNV